MGDQQKGWSWSQRRCENMVLELSVFAFGSLVREEAATVDPSALKGSQTVAAREHMLEEPEFESPETGIDGSDPLSLEITMRPGVDVALWISHPLVETLEYAEPEQDDQGPRQTAVLQLMPEALDPDRDLPVFAGPPPGRAADLELFGVDQPLPAVLALLPGVLHSTLLVDIEGDADDDGGSQWSAHVWFK